MSNYLEKGRSIYHIIYKYIFGMHITPDNIFNKLNPDDFLICCRYQDMVKEHNYEKEFSKKEKMMINILKKKALKFVPENKQNFFNSLDALVYHDDKLWTVNIFSNIIKVKRVPSIQIGNNIINEIIKRMSTDIEKNIQIKCIQIRYIILRLKGTHEFNQNILTEIKNNLLVKFDNKSIYSSPNMLSAKVKLGKLYIFKNGNISLASSKFITENEIIEYINNLLSGVNKCDNNCEKCKTNKGNKLCLISKSTDIDEEYIPNIVFI